MKKISILLFFVCLSATTYGQTKRAFQKAAEEAYEAGNYYAALTYYNEVLEFDDKNIEALKRSAEAAMKFNAYDVAVEKYTFLIDSLGDNSDSTALIHAAKMFQRLAKYDKATEYFDRYISEYGKEDDEWTIKAKREKEASALASARIKEVDSSYVLNQLTSDVNSNFSDFGAVMDGDSIIYSSMRFLEEDSERKPARQLSKLLSNADDGSSYPVDGDFNKRNQPVANVAFNPERSKIFYTVCDYIEESKLRCDLYSSTITVDGQYIDERKLPSVINDSSYTSTHPFIANDPITGNDILYFVSDRSGGKGGLDIWYSIFEPKLGYSKAINLSSINTENDEVSPFYHPSTNMLYFSSDGYLGLGGYDVYQSRYNGGLYEDPMSLPAPINSSYHDMYYTLDDEGINGYLSSNREGAAYIDSKLKACCFDIYSVRITPRDLDLIALTYDKLTDEDLLEATVSIYDKNTGDLISQLTADTTNKHPFKVLENKDYLIVGSKPGFIADTVELSTFNIDPLEPIETKLYLEPEGVSLDVFTFDASTREKLIGTTVVLEDLTDPTQNQIIEINELDNDFHFSLDFDKSYKIVAKKNGYTAISEIIDTRGVTGKISRNLYLKVFDLAAYLPIALFFDNDEPEPDSKSTYTEMVYGDLLNAYMARKETFMDKYGKGATGDAKQRSIEGMEEFFEGDVKGGYDQFKVFMDGLVNELKSGKRIDMTIRGYASPRFDVKYNLVLAQRRINSVRNDMELYEGGVLRSYLLNKQLIITEISYGEELAPSDVNDNIYDERESIYSLRASKQRRVEVVSVISK